MSAKMQTAQQLKNTDNKSLADSSMKSSTRTQHAPLAHDDACIACSKI
jgi:hypothetical protein